MKKLYTILIKSHCEAPDYEHSILAESRRKAIDRFYKALQGEYDKDFIDKQMDEGV